MKKNNPKNKPAPIKQSGGTNPKGKASPPQADMEIERPNDAKERGTAHISQYPND